MSLDFLLNPILYWGKSITFSLKKLYKLANEHFYLLSANMYICLSLTSKKKVEIRLVQKDKAIMSENKYYLNQLILMLQLEGKIKKQMIKPLGQ